MNNNILVSEIALMQRVFESDSKALELLYNSYSPLLYTLVKKIIKDKKAAEEILIDVFGIIWRKVKYFNFDTNNTFTWIVNITKNKSIDALRRKLNKGIIPEYSLEYENDYILPRLSLVITPLDLEKALSSKDKIEKALNSLTNAQQYVIYLAFYEGLTQQEISAKLKIPQQTVRSKIRTSLKNLNEKFTGAPTLYTVTNEIVELVYPFSLGCLDYKEIQGTVNAFRNMENFPWKVLGEYQNLTALLPVILNIEKPTTKLKEKISTHLYHLRRDETMKLRDTLEKSNEDKKSSFSQAESAISGVKFEKVESLKEKKQQKPDRGKFKGFDSVDSDKQSKNESRQGNLEDIIKEQENRKRKSYTGLITIIFILVLIAASAAAYILYKNRANDYEKHIENLNLIIESLKEDNLTRPEIPGLGDLRNMKTADLERTDIDSLSIARIFLSFTDKSGYLHITYLPPLPPNRGYQLWGNFFTAENIETNRRGAPLSLGTFKVSSRPDYYPFRFPEVPDAIAVEFFVTEAPVYGLRTPGPNVYLSGRVE